MTTAQTTAPLNSREYHEDRAAHHADRAAYRKACLDFTAAANHEHYAAYHAAEALTAAPAQTAPEGLAR